MPETGTPTDARDHIKALEKDLAKSKSALETAMGENRGYAAKDAFAEAGFAPQFADLYTASQPEGELTKEAIETWALGYGIDPVPATEPVEGEPKTEPTVTDGSENLAAMGRGGSNPEGQGQPPTPTETMPIPEWQALYRRDPDAAKQAVADGKVELRGDNPYVPNYSQAENPYANRGKTEQTTQ